MEMQMKKFTSSHVKELRASALQSVIVKLDSLSRTASFKNTRWIFDWDDSKAPIDNIDMCNAEFDSLMLLQNEKVIDTKTVPTPDISISLNMTDKGFREQKDYSISEISSYLPEADEAGKHYHTAVWITRFDKDKFLEYLNARGDGVKKIQNTGMQIITARSYDPNTGTLYFKGETRLVLQKSRVGNRVGETAQGRAMRLLFNDVNTLHKGVSLYKFLSVRKDHFDKTKHKRAINHLTAINKKIQDVTGVPKLIIHDKVNYYIDKSYL